MRKIYGIAIRRHMLVEVIKIAMIPIPTSICAAIWCHLVHLALRITIIRSNMAYLRQIWCQEALIFYDTYVRW